MTVNSEIMEFVNKYKSLYRTLFALAIPIALQNLITYGVGFADNVMVGSLGDLALSGVFLSNQVQNILHMFTSGVAAAMVVLATQYFGRDDQKNAKMIISIAMKLCLAVGIFCSIAVALFPQQILRLFTDEEAVIAEGIKYIKIVCWSYTLFCANSVLLSSMRCVHSTNIGMYSSLTGFIMNIFLNWVLIYGKLGAPQMGVSGAALATLISRMAEMLISYMYVRYIDKKLMLRPRDLLHAKMALVQDFFRYGFPVILGDVTWGIAGTVQVAILGRLGSEVVAANTVAANLSQIFGVVVYAVAAASGVIVGRMVGTEQYDLLKEYTRPLQAVYIAIGLVTGLATFLCKNFILSIGFTGLSPEAYEYANQFISVLSITIVGTAYQMSVLTGIVRAGGATDFVLKNDLFWMWIVVIPSALLAGFVLHAPPVVVFICLKSDQILKCSVAFVKLRRFNWIKNLTRDQIQ